MIFANDEYKVKLTLSSNYYNRFCTDLFTFDIKSSTLITAIVHAYCEDSDKLTVFEESKKHSDSKTISSDILSILLSDSLRFVNALKNLSNERDAIEANRTRRYFSKGATKTIQWRLSEDIRNELSGDSRSHNQPLSFIRDLIEEYLELPFEKRESVVLYKQIHDVERAIKQNRAFEYTYKSGFSCVMHPYKIMDDHDLHSKYVIGHSVPSNEYDASTFSPNEENISVIRLLNMQYTRDNFNILCDQRQINEKAIEEKLSFSSIAFISQNVCDITVLLTPTGENMLRTIVHGRPQYISRSEQYENGLRCYKLRATPFQASIYFCSFEDHAQIIDPPEAITALKSRIKKASKIYCSD